MSLLPGPLVDRLLNFAYFFSVEVLTVCKKKLDAHVQFFLLVLFSLPFGRKSRHVNLGQETLSVSD